MSQALLEARPAWCECLNLGWAEDMGDGDRVLRPPPNWETSFPDLAMFVAAL